MVFAVAQVVVAVRRDDDVLDARHMVAQILDLGAELLRQAVARRVRDVDDRRARLDGRLDHPRQILVLRASGVLRVELHVVHELPRVLDRRHAALDDLLARRVELVLDVEVRRADARVDALALRVLQRVRSHVDVLHHRSRQRTYRRPRHRLRNLLD